MSGPVIIAHGRKQWRNWHNTVYSPIADLYDIHNADAHNASLEGLNATSAAIEDLIAKARADGVRLRALGSGWSLSPAATTDGYMLNTAYLNYKFEIGGRYIDTDFKGDRENLMLVQCGCQISELNEYLETSATPRSLRTTGAANGQTLIGAASTGTHGSTLKFGAVHDQILGLLLLTGENGRVWLERAIPPGAGSQHAPHPRAGYHPATSSPAGSQHLADKLGARLVRDDALFNAALVSFGAFGIIHAALLEVRALTVLESHNVALPYDDAMRDALDTLDLSQLPLKIDDAGPRNDAERPEFWQVILNPFEAEDRTAYVTSMFDREPSVDDEPKPKLEEGLKPGYDTLSLMGAVTDLAPPLAATLARLLDDSLIKFKDPVRATYGTLFAYKPPKTKVASFSLFVDARDTSRVLDRLVPRIRETYAPVAVVCRFVQKSEATLGPNRFDMSCAIGVDGVKSKVSSKLFKWIVDDLKAAGVPFTQHWGKDGAYDAATVRLMYGDQVDVWKSARTKLLSAADRQVFSSKFTVEAGLT